MGYAQIAENERMRKEREQHREANRQRALKLAEASNVAPALHFISDDDAHNEDQFHLNNYKRPNGECYILHRSGPTRSTRLEDGKLAWDIPITKGRNIVSTEKYRFHTLEQCKVNDG
jgi:hypothetical protein